MLLGHPLDQSLPKTEEAKEIVLRKVDTAIAEAENVDQALDIVHQLYIIQELSGLALAKSIYGIEKRFKVDREYIYQKLGKHKHTIDRYIRIWAMFAEGYVPDKYYDAIQDRNIKDLVPIGNAIEQGYDITQDQWRKLAEAPDFNTVSKIVREEIKQEEPRKSLLQIHWKPNGDLWAYQGDESAMLGYLIRDEHNPLAKKALARLTDGKVLEI